jgi:hypothetical protein
MTTITFQCYSCNQVLRVGSDKAGRKAKCTKCGTILTIPAAGAEPPAASPPRPAARPPAGATPPRGATPPKPPPLAKQTDDFDFDVGDQPRPRPRGGSRRDEPPEAIEERPRSRRREQDEEQQRPRSRRDEEEDRPRGRRRDEDEAYEERPRSRRRDEGEEYEERPRARRRDEEEDEEDYDRPRGRRRDRDEEGEEREERRPSRPRDKWPKVRIGLLLNFISSAILIGASGFMCLAVLLFVIGMIARSLGLLQAVEVPLKIGIILYFILQMPAVAGYVFTIFTPNKNAALPLGITALSLGAINLVLKLLMVISMFGGPRGLDMGPADPGMLAMGIRGAVAVMVIVSILVLAVLCSEWIIFPLYLRAVGFTLKDRYAAGGAMPPMFMACAILALWIVFIILSTIVMGSAMRGAGGGGEAWLYIFSFLALIIFGLTTGFAVMFMRAIGGIRSAIPD